MKDIVEIQVNIGCGPSWNRDFRADYTPSQLEARERGERIIAHLNQIGIHDTVEVGLNAVTYVALGTSDEHTVCARWRVDARDVMLSVRCIARYTHSEEDQEAIAFRVLETRTDGVRQVGLIREGDELGFDFDPAKFIIPHAWLIIQPSDRLALLEDMPV